MYYVSFSHGILSEGFNRQNRTMCSGQVEGTPEHHLLTLTHVSRDMTIKALVRDACPALIIWEAQGTLLLLQGDPFASVTNKPVSKWLMRTLLLL